MTTQFIEDYNNLVKDTIQNGSLQFNDRTGQHLRSIKDGVFISIDLNQGLMPIPANRKYFVKSAASEFAWMIKGSQDLKFLQQYTSMWDKFATDNKIHDAYGHRLQVKWTNQIQAVINLLENDKTNRRAVMNIWDAKDIESKTTAPCPTQMIFSINNNTLNGFLTLRSSDVFVGLPYDIMTWSYVVKMVANSLGYDRCFLKIFIVDLHIYEDHVKLYSDRDDHLTEVPMHPFTYDQMKTRPERIIEWTTSLEERFWPKIPYSPMPEVFV